jgi:hypothetical protein
VGSEDQGDVLSGVAQFLEMREGASRGRVDDDVVIGSEAARQQPLDALDYLLFVVDDDDTDARRNRLPAHNPSLTAAERASIPRRSK